MFDKSFYNRAPVWFQNVLLSFRAVIKKRLRECAKSDQICLQLKSMEFDSIALNDYREKHLQLTLNNAVSNVPFYHLLKGVDVKSLDSFPFVTKGDVRSQPADFESEQKPKWIVSGSTSGTTGSPLSIPQSLDSVLREQAFITRSLDWAGYKKGDKRAWIRGDMIVPIEQTKPPYWRYSYFEDMMLLSSFHMTTAALPLYIEAMVNYGVDVIQAYPSSIVTIAKYLESKGRFYPGKVKSVLTSSETLSFEDRQVIEERFRCKVFDWYGLFERVAAIANCEHGRYHVLTDYSHVEFFDAGNGSHEIVGTNYNNLYYPLIRYKTGDHVVLSRDKDCPCGRVYPMVDQVDGRVGDYLIGENGQKVYILNHIPKGVDGLIECQFIQDEPGVICVLAVVEPTSFDCVQENYLTQNVKERLGRSMAVEIKYVEALQRTKNGKVRQAICTL